MENIPVVNTLITLPHVITETIPLHVNAGNINELLIHDNSHMLHNFQKLYYSQGKVPGRKSGKLGNKSFLRRII